jgi:hypothetical protein
MLGTKKIKQELEYSIRKVRAGYVSTDVSKFRRRSARDYISLYFTNQFLL